MCLITANFRVCETPPERLTPDDEGMGGLLWSVYTREGELISEHWYEDSPEGALEVAIGSEQFTLEMMDDSWIEWLRSTLG